MGIIAYYENFQIFGHFFPFRDYDAPLAPQNRSTVVTVSQAVTPGLV
jgi:hypothetical protein